jgi:hypothetical protein
MGLRESGLSIRDSIVIALLDGRLVGNCQIKKRC